VGTVSTEDNAAFAELRFSSLRHLAFNTSRGDGIAEIVYYIQKSETNGYLLRRSDRVDIQKPFEKNNKDPVLCNRITSFQLIYYNQGEESFENWDSDSSEFEYATPKAVGIRLEMETASGPQIFETMVNLPVFREKQK
jgi:general secretion pathway protein J